MLQSGNLLVHWWSIRGTCRVSATYQKWKEHTAQSLEERKKTKQNKNEGPMSTPGTFGTRICTTVRECWHWNRIAKGCFSPSSELERCVQNFFPRVSAMPATTGQQRAPSLCVSNYPFISEPWQAAHQEQQGKKIWRVYICLSDETYMQVQWLRKQNLHLKNNSCY